MGISIEYKMSNVKGLAQKFPRPTASALNKMAKQSRTTVSKSVREDYTISKSDLDETLSISRATPVKLFAVITSKGVRLALTKFRASWSRHKEGAKVIIKKGQMKIIPHTFIATMPSGHKGVMERVGTRALPIRELKGPAAAHLISSKKVQDDVSRQINEKFYDILLHELEYYMNIRKGRA